jgi:hypothetical protein
VAVDHAIRPDQDQAAAPEPATQHAPRVEKVTPFDDHRVRRLEQRRFETGRCSTADGNPCHPRAKQTVKPHLAAIGCHNGRLRKVPTTPTSPKEKATLKRRSDTRAPQHPTLAQHRYRCQAPQ